MPVKGIVKQCGATKRDGTLCPNPAMVNGRCRIHGGKSPQGIASPHFVTGSRAKYVPSRLQQNYQEYLNEPTGVEMRRLRALLDSRIDDLLEKTDHGESGELWKSLGEGCLVLAEQIRQERNSDGDYAERIRNTDTALESLGLLIAQGGQDWQTWQEIRETGENLGKTVDRITKRELATVNMITQVQQMELLKRVAAIIRDYVRDPNDLANAARRLHELAGVAS